MKRLLTFLACTGLAPLSLAFQSAQRPPHLLPYPAGLVSGTATQACVGQFSDDVVADGALLIGGEVWLLYAPERVSSYSKVSSPFSPFSSMAKVSLSQSSAREGLLACSSAGLVLLQWDTSARRLSSTLVLANSIWANASQLQAVSFGTGSTTKICAVSSSGTRILRAEWTGAQIIADSSGSLAVSTPILSLAGVNWNGDGKLDFAYDDGLGLHVISDLGAQLYVFSINCSQPQVLRMPGAGTTDNVIWLTQNPYGAGQVLTVAHLGVGPNSNWIEPPVFSGTMVIARLTLADIDADGRQDLVLTRSDAPSALVLYRQTSGSMSFGLTGGSGGGSGQSYDLSAVKGTCAGIPVVASGDLDGDGDEDLLFAGQVTCANQALVCFANGVDDEGVGSKHPKAWMVNLATFVDWAWPLIPPAPNPDVAHLTLTPWPSPGPLLAGTPTDIRVTIWSRPSDPGLMQPLRLADTFVAVSTAPFPPPFTVDIPLPASPVDPLRYLVVEVSYVQRISGTVVHAFPVWTGEIDRTIGIPYLSGGTTTGGINRPPPPPTGTPPSP